MNSWFSCRNEIWTFGDHTVDIENTSKVWLQIKAKNISLRFTYATYEYHDGHVLPDEIKKLV